MPVAGVKEALLPEKLLPVTDADFQSKRLLTNSTFTTLHELRNLGNRRLALRMPFQVSNIFFRPGNALLAPVSCFAFHSH
jgi:hypothetical protein